MKLESRKRLQIKNNLYKVSIVSFVTVVAWIGFEIYWSYQNPQIPETVKQQIKPLNPNLDFQLLDSLQRRKHITVNDLSAFQQSLISTQQEPSPTPNPPPSASTTSGQLIPSNQN